MSFLACSILAAFHIGYWRSQTNICLLEPWRCLLSKILPTPFHLVQYQLGISLERSLEDDISVTLSLSLSPCVFVCVDRSSSSSLCDRPGIVVFLSRSFGPLWVMLKLTRDVFHCWCGCTMDRRFRKL